MQILGWPYDKERANNPYQWLLYRRIAALGARVEQYTRFRLLFRRYDVVHLHWPERYLNERSPVRMLAYTLMQLVLLTLARARGAVVIWTMHNVAAHEGRYPRIERWFWARLGARVDGVIALGQSALASARARFPWLHERPTCVIPHGHYCDAYPNRISRAQAREKLGLPADSRVIVTLGAVRPYKNLGELVQCFGALPDAGARLIIAGRAEDPAEAMALQRTAAADVRVRPYLWHVPDNRIQVYLNAADLVVIPYARVLNSGSAMLALSFARPLLVPAHGSLRELAAWVGPQWMRLYGPPLQTATLADALDWAADERPAMPDLSWADWPRLAEHTLSFYRRVIHEGRPAVAREVA